MAESKYYIPPAGQGVGASLAGLGDILSRNRERKAQEEALASEEAARQQVTQDMAAALQTGDVDRVQELALANPWITESLDSAMGIGGEMRGQQKADELSFYQGITANPAQAAALAQDRLEMLNQAGRGSEQTQMLLEELSNPETRADALQTVDTMFRVKYPEEYADYMATMPEPVEEDYNKPFLSDGSPNPAYQEYQRSLRASGAPQTTINMPSPVDKATETFGEGIGDRANQRLEQAASAQSQNMQLERMSEAIESGIDTGIGQSALLTLKNIGQSLFNLPISEEASEQEVVQSLSNRLALEIRNPTSGLGLPGSTSNRDLQFLIDAVPGLQRTPEGNALMIDYFMKINEMKRDVAQKQQEIIDANNGTVPSNLDSQLMEYIDSYELLDEQERELLDEAVEMSNELTPAEQEELRRLREKYGR